MFYIRLDYNISITRKKEKMIRNTLKGRPRVDGALEANNFESNR